MVAMEPSFRPMLQHWDVMDAQIKRAADRNPEQFVRQIAALAARHEAAAAHFNKRRHCVAGEFHAFTADTLRAAAKALEADHG